MRTSKKLSVWLSMLAGLPLIALLALNSAQVANAGCAIGWSVYAITCDVADSGAPNHPYTHDLNTEYFSQNLGTWYLAQGITCGGSTNVVCSPAPTATPASTMIVESSGIASGVIPTACAGRLKADNSDPGTSTLSAWRTAGICSGSHDVQVLRAGGTCP